MSESTRNERRQQEMEIDLWKLGLLYLDHWRLIVASVLLCAGVALFWTANFITPLYRASVTVYVNNVRSDQQIDYISAANLATSQQLVNTYVNIIRSDTVLEKVVDAEHLEYTAAEIRGMMTASQVDETELFNIYISHPDPEMAARIANAVAEVAPGEIESFVEGSSTKIIDYAKVPDHRYTPSYRRNVALGGMVGGVLALGYVTLLYLLDVRVKDEDDLIQLFDAPVLGRIPAFASGEPNRNKPDKAGEKKVGA